MYELSPLDILIVIVGIAAVIFTEVVRRKTKRREDTRRALDLEAHMGASNQVALSLAQHPPFMVIRAECLTLADMKTTVLVTCSRAVFDKTDPALFKELLNEYLLGRWCAVQSAGICDKHSNVIRPLF